jgi:hypothetical protein
MRFSCLKHGHGSSQHEERARDSIGFADLANGRGLAEEAETVGEFPVLPESLVTCVSQELKCPCPFVKLHFVHLLPMFRLVLGSKYKVQICPQGRVAIYPLLLQYQALCLISFN